MRLEPDPDPDPDIVRPERLDPDPDQVNIRLDPQPFLSLTANQKKVGEHEKKAPAWVRQGR